MCLCACILSFFKGPVGPPGPTGDTGPPGAVVVPDPLNINDLNVATTATFSGTVTCPGGALDPSCFGLAVCPDFSTCDIAARSLTLDAGVPFTSLTVGSVGDGGMTTVTMGDSGVPNYVIQSFKLNAVVAVYDTIGSQQFRTLNGAMSMVVNGGILQPWSVTSSGSASITAGSSITLTAANQGVLITSSALNSDITLSSGRNVILVGSSQTHQASTYTVQEGPGNPWFETDPTNTLSCGTVNPLPTVGGKSIVYDDDIILSAGVNLMSAAVDGLLRMGGGIELCGVLIHTQGPTLQLQDDTATDVLDIRATITNGDGANSVTFSESNGVDFADTPILNSGGAALGTIAGAVYISDPEGLETAGNIVSGAAITAATGNIGGTAFAAGGVITGVTMINGMPYNAGAGPCCTSDRRVKEHVKVVSPLEDLTYVLGLPKRIAFKYKKDYQDADAWVKDHVYHSFIAQEVEKHDPTLVHSVEQKVGSVIYHDLKKLDLQRAVPRVVGAIKGIHMSHQQLKKDHEKLTLAYENLKTQVASMHDKLESLTMLVSNKIS